MDPRDARQFRAMLLFDRRNHHQYLRPAFSPQPATMAQDQYNMWSMNYAFSQSEGSENGPSRQR